MEQHGSEALLQISPGKCPSVLECCPPLLASALRAYIVWVSVSQTPAPGFWPRILTFATKFHKTTTICLLRVDPPNPSRILDPWMCLALFCQAPCCSRLLSYFTCCNPCVNPGPRGSVLHSPQSPQWSLTWFNSCPSSPEVPSFPCHGHL
jgi:hypothetical protein